MAQFAIPSQPTGPDAPAPQATQTEASIPQDVQYPEPHPATQNPPDLNVTEPPQQTLYAGKFKSVEDLANAYKELERKLGQLSQKPLREELNPQQPEPQQQSQKQDQKVNLSAYQQEIVQTGGLSDKSYAELEQLGFDREFVDSVIAGRQALVEKAINDVTAEIGGPEVFQQMAEWAKANLDRADILAYNEAVTSGDPARMRLAVKALKARYEEAEGKAPNLAAGRGGGGVTGFSSIQEMTRWQKDPRYQSGDPAFHAMFDAKLRASKF